MSGYPIPRKNPDPLLKKPPGYPGDKKSRKNPGNFRDFQNLIRIPGIFGMLHSEFFHDFFKVSIRQSRKNHQSRRYPEKINPDAGDFRDFFRNFRSEFFRDFQILIPILGFL